MANLGGYRPKGYYNESIDYSGYGNDGHDTGFDYGTNIDTNFDMSIRQPELGGSGLDWRAKDYISAGLGGLQGITGLLNYRENKKFNKARISGLNEQIASSKYARGAHQNFVSNTNKSFG